MNRAEVASLVLNMMAQVVLQRASALEMHGKEASTDYFDGKYNALRDVLHNLPAERYDARTVQALLAQADNKVARKTDRKRYTLHLTLTRSQHKRLLLVAGAMCWTAGEVARSAFNDGLSTMYRKMAGGTDNRGQRWEQEDPNCCAICGLRLADTPGTSPDGVICQACDTVIELEVAHAEQ